MMHAEYSKTLTKTLLYMQLNAYLFISSHVVGCNNGDSGDFWARIKAMSSTLVIKKQIRE